MKKILNFLAFISLVGCSLPINYQNAPDLNPPLKITGDLDQNLTGNNYPIPELKK